MARNYEGPERCQRELELHEELTRILAYNKFSVAIIIFCFPTCLGYLTYEHMQREKLIERITVTENRIESIDKIGTERLKFLASKHHAASYCHFTGRK